MADGLPKSTLLTAPGASPDRWIVLLHGILGQGNNWRGFARRLVADRPDWGAALVDLRAHGGSRDLPPPDSVERAAEDVALLWPTLPGELGAVLGHSFGGKVALALLERGPVPRLFVVDSLPGPRPDRRGSEDTVAVLRMLAALPPRFGSRDAFVAHAMREGTSETVAKWLAQNLEREPDGSYRFGLDVRRIEALLDDYFARDLWPVLDPPPAGTRAHLVVGGRSRIFGEADRERARALAARHPEAVSVHVLERAGHWVHVDDPDGLLAIVEAAL
ncbi:MAG TPA: alpha/beta hydrolase [Sandaracinaceae bacterium]